MENEKNNERFVVDAKNIIIEDYDSDVKSLSTDEMLKKIDDISNEMLKQYYDSIDSSSLNGKKKR